MCCGIAAGGSGAGAGAGSGASGSSDTVIPVSGWRAGAGRDWRGCGAAPAAFWVFSRSNLASGTSEGIASFRTVLRSAPSTTRSISPVSARWKLTSSQSMVAMTASMRTANTAISGMLSIRYRLSICADGVKTTCQRPSFRVASALYCSAAPLPATAISSSRAKFPSL